MLCTEPSPNQGKTIDALMDIGVSRRAPHRLGVPRVDKDPHGGVIGFDLAWAGVLVAGCADSRAGQPALDGPHGGNL